MIVKFGGLLEYISMVAHREIGNKIDNIMVVRKMIILWVFFKRRFIEINKTIYMIVEIKDIRNTDSQTKYKRREHGGHKTNAYLCIRH